jgi:hypothetical protein
MRVSSTAATDQDDQPNTNGARTNNIKYEQAPLGRV